MQQQVAPPQQQQQSSFSIWKMILIYFIVTQIFSAFKSLPPNTYYSNIFENGELFNIRVVINTSESNPFIWNQMNIFYDTQDINFRTANFTIKAKELLDNPYITAFVEIDLPSKNYALSKQFRLCDSKMVKKLETKNLMFDANQEYMIQNQQQQNGTKVLHVKNTAIINLIYDTTNYPIGQIPVQFLGKYTFSNSTWGLKYIPYLDVSHYRLRRKDYILVEDPSVDLDQEFTIQIEFSPYNYWKFLIAESLQDSGKVYEKFGMENVMDEVSQDQMKEMIYETNIYLFVVTMVVSVLHTIFSTLAIKNDIQYWKNLDSNTGISIRSLYQNFFIEIIITLYLFDNETSYLILVQSVIELGLMIWKILKTTKFHYRADGKFPYISLEHKKSYSLTTEEHDKQATRYLYMILLPLFICYLVYSLIYEEHKGWYSFFLSSCVGFIYIFGFINMTPQLYINYKLKSVAHLPWRMMIYKFLNTIIDDLFAFIITMPWLKRLSCFRDGFLNIILFLHPKFQDIIFLIYIYQRRIYRVDKDRQEPGIAQETPPKENTVEQNHLKQE